MTETITLEWLKENHACGESLKAFDKETNHDVFATLERLKAKNREWGNWLIVRLMTHRQTIQYAIFAAEQVIDIFEKKYPDDYRPRLAIEAARDYLKDPSAKNKKAAAAYAAAAAAANAAYAAYAAAAADAAANAAYAADASSAAADASSAAAYAAYAAANAADAAAAANAANAAAAYVAARIKMLTKILKYGIKLL